MREIPVDVVFIARAPTLASRICVRRRGRLGSHVSAGVRALVVPGSRRVKDQAELEGLDRVFTEAALSGVSRLLDVPGNEPDILTPGQRCASTSNRTLRVAKVAGSYPFGVARGCRSDRDHGSLRFPEEVPT